MANYIVINPLFTRTAQETLLVTLHILSCNRPGKYVAG